jgi:hypothetical protein
MAEGQLAESIKLKEQSRKRDVLFSGQQKLKGGRLRHLLILLFMTNPLVNALLESQLSQ